MGELTWQAALGAEKKQRSGKRRGRRKKKRVRSERLDSVTNRHIERERRERESGASGSGSGSGSGNGGSHWSLGAGWQKKRYADNEVKEEGV